jgi:hypothetical protein
MSTIVREAFRDQARWCDQLGSPFTARVCRLCAEHLDASDPVAARLLGWQGDPSAKADALPLRLAGALHFLARSARSSALRAVYPPNVATDDELWRAIAGALGEHAAFIGSHLDSPPQTNETMRSAALLPGLLTIAARTGRPLELYEIGASAGLNLVLDRYRYRLGDASWGVAESPVEIAPRWQGSLAAIDTPLRIAARQGVDLNPIDLRDAAARERLLSYVWADQADRLQRLEAATALWLRDPPRIERGDAAEWLERSTLTQARAGVARVLFHSITWHYLPAATRDRITRLLDELGARASVEAPLAWLRFELATDAAELRLSQWPGARDQLLATGHPHGTAVRWLAG